MSLIRRWFRISQIAAIYSGGAPSPGGDLIELESGAGSIELENGAGSIELE